MCEKDWGRSEKRGELREVVVVVGIKTFYKAIA